MSAPIEIVFRAGACAVRCERNGAADKSRWFLIAGEQEQEIPESEVSEPFVRACRIIFEEQD